MRKHKFTWFGDAVTCCFLGKELNVTRATIYNVAIDCKSDCGEDIKDYLKRSPGRYRMVEFDGKMRSKKEIANRVGISAQTLRYREKTYGPDCCLTYFPGRIPAHLLPPATRKAKKTPKITIGNGQGGNALWKNMGGKHRSANMALINVGSFEIKMPCPPAGTGNANEYI